MQAASRHLTPVTLELGGKSPAIIHGDYPLHHAAERIAAGKFFNAGQTCIAPDYVLTPRDRLEATAQSICEAVESAYPRIAANPDYTSIINPQHKARLERYLADAQRHGARVCEINPAKESFEAAGNKLPLPGGRHRRHARDAGGDLRPYPPIVATTTSRAPSAT